MIQQFTWWWAALLVLMFPTLSAAQTPSEPFPPRKCGWDHTIRTAEDLRRLSIFNAYIQERVRERAARREQEYEVVQIPVVMHIVHNGEPVGTGANVSAAQVYSQFEVLNEDFRRRNADAVQTPDLFRPVAADARIEFVPAEVDPQGRRMAEPGINRVRVTETAFSIAEANQLVKPQTIWNPTRYANVWVLPRIRFDVLAFAQFPANSGLPGLAPSDGAANTDGIIIDYRYLGRPPHNTHPSPFNQGRTLTHEFGHFFGLLHTWGAFPSCLEDDFVDDTPLQQGPSRGCPPFPLSSCGFQTMHQNYLDYTDDACMNIFTAQQVARMRTVLEVSPARRELVNSPVITRNRVVAAFRVEKEGNCPNSTVRLLNDSFGFGSGTIRSFRWSFPGGTPATSSAAAPAVTYQQPGTFDIELIVEGDVNRDTLRLRSAVSIVDYSGAARTPETEEGFEGSAFPPAGWGNPSGLWRQDPTSGRFSQSAAVAENFSTQPGTFIELTLPIMTGFGSGQNPEWLFTFDIAYAMRENTSIQPDSLALIVRDLCQGTQRVLWAVSGEELQTSPRTNRAFLPNRNQWRRERMLLTGQLPQFAQLAFVVLSRGNNNLFLDNIGLINIASLPVSERLKVFPNPVSDELVLEPTGLAIREVRLLDTTGRVVLQAAMPQPEPFTARSLFVQHLPAGLYILQILTEEGAVTKRIFVAK